MMRHANLQIRIPPPFRNFSSYYLLAYYIHFPWTGKCVSLLNEDSQLHKNSCKMRHVFPGASSNNCKGGKDRDGEIEGRNKMSIGEKTEK